MPDRDRAQQVSARSLRHNRQAGASKKTVLIALAANAVVAIVKFIAGLVSGSTSLLAEAAHSLADTTNQAFLLASIALGRREPTPEQPFGYGHQRYLWSFMAAVAMFLAGAIFAIGYGVYELLQPPSGEEGGFAAAWIALAIAFVAEGTSWVRAVRQTRSEAQRIGMPAMRYTRVSRDPNVKMVVFEDSAALAGVAIAAAGIGLHQITGTPAFDSIASILIGVLLIVVALFMGRDFGQLLIGSAARPDERAEMERVLERHPGVDRVEELLTLVLGPNALLVAARIDLADDVESEAVERMSDELDEQLREAVPDVTEVFLDATPSPGGS